MMTCGLCKQLIRGDEHYTVDHYECGVKLTQAWQNDVADTEAMRDELLDVLRRIADDTSECGCDHIDQGHCCAYTEDGIFCARCVAALALRAAECSLNGDIR